MRLFKSFLAASCAASCLMMTGPSQAESYAVTQWPQDIGKIPCAAWRKSPDGGWSQVGTIQAGARIISGQTFKPTSGEGRMLAAKCGN